MAPKHSPAFQFYPDDFMGGAPSLMTVDEIGLYVILLCLDWNGNGFVFEAGRIALLAKVTKPRLLRLWERVSLCFPERDGRRFNPRLEIEREKQRAYSVKMSINGSLGGRPAESRGKADRKPKQSTPFPIPSPKELGVNAGKANGTGVGYREWLARNPDPPKEVRPIGDDDDLPF